jgi:hypothetical protein
LATIAFGVLSGPGLAETHRHTLTDLDPAFVYEVLVDGTVVATGLAPSFDGFLAFSTETGGSVQVVPVGAGDPTPPGAVTDLELGGVEGTSAAITWRATGDDGEEGMAARYEVRASTDSTEAYVWEFARPLGDLPASVAAGAFESGTVEGLFPLSVNYVALRAVDDGGNRGPVSIPLAILAGAGEGGDPGDLVAPAQVLDLLVDHAGQTSISISWTATGDDGLAGRATDYDIRIFSSPPTESTFGQGVRVGDADFGPGGTAPAAPGTEETFEITGLDANEVYYLALEVIDDAGNRSPMSNVVEAGTSADQAPFPPPPAPAGAFDGTQVLLIWEAIPDPGVIGYHVYRRREGDPRVRLTGGPITATQYVDVAIEDGPLYRYQVTAVDTSGVTETAYSAETLVRTVRTVPPALRVERIYPNPIRAQATFRVEVPEPGPGYPDGVSVTIDVYDVAGRKMARVVDTRLYPGMREVTWSLAASPVRFPPGRYTSLIRAGGRATTAPIAVTR